MKKITTFLKKMKPAHVLFNHTGHDTSHGWGDRRLVWGEDGELLLESIQDSGALTIQATEKKMRIREGGLLKPFMMSFDGRGWTHEVGAAQSNAGRSLTERQSWLFMTAMKMLEKGMYVTGREGPVAYTAELREAYRAQYFAADKHGSAERNRWMRDVKACVSYFTVDADYFYSAKG